jgi:hypothetical protein
LALKLSLDLKFLLTAALTFLVTVTIATVVYYVAGPGAATVAGTVMGGIAVKLFDKLDYSPTFDIEFTGARVSSSWLYSLLAAVLILSSSDFLFEAGKIAIAVLSKPVETCGPLFWAVLIPLDWAGFAISGWVIGKLFPDKALVLSSIAATLVIILFGADLRFGGADPMAAMAKCFPPVPPEEADHTRFVFLLGLTAGMAARGYLAIAMARLASRSGRA